MRANLLTIKSMDFASILFCSTRLNLNLGDDRQHGLIPINWVVRKIKHIHRHLLSQNPLNHRCCFG